MLTFTEFSKLVQQRQLLDGQLNENKSVLDELNLLGDDNKVNILSFLPSKLCHLNVLWTLLGLQTIRACVGETRA